ncbi:MAG TPA: hypothetical protein VM222_01300 [Planctomycetota bacterium]|nr:hypothetical protein [Planctomycetota bacterium]
MVALILASLLQSVAQVEDKTCRDAFRSFELSVEQAKSLKVRFQTSAYKADGYPVVIEGVLVIKGDRIRADLVENDPTGLKKNTVAKPKRIWSDGKKLLATYGDEKVLEIDTPKSFRANVLTALTRLGIAAPLAELPLAAESLLLGKKKGSEDWVLKPKVGVEFMILPNAHEHPGKGSIVYTLRIDDGSKAGILGSGSRDPGGKDRPPGVHFFQQSAGSAAPRTFYKSINEIWREYSLDPVLADEEFVLPAEKK